MAAHSPERSWDQLQGAAKFFAPTPSKTSCLGSQKRTRLTRFIPEPSFFWLLSLCTVTFLLFKRSGQRLGIAPVRDSFLPPTLAQSGGNQSGNGLWRNESRERLMLVTGMDGQPCTSARGAEVLTKSLKNKVDYARLHNLRMYYSMETFDDAYDLYWIKFPLLKKLMAAYSEVEWFMWVDCDAIFTDMAIEVPLDKYDNYNLVFTGNEKDVYDEPHWLGLNTGGFLIRNCAWSRKLMDAAMDMGNKYTKRDPSKDILNKMIRGREEAGPNWPADDQTTIIYLLATQPRRWKSMTYLDNDLTYHTWWVAVMERLEAMLAGNGVAGPDGHWPFITHFTGCKFCNPEYGDGKIDECFESFDRLFLFADNQILEQFGLRHRSVTDSEIEVI